MAIWKEIKALRQTPTQQAHFEMALHGTCVLTRAEYFSLN